MNDNANDNAPSEETISRLYRETRREEPPLKLDSAVLSTARQAVAKPARSRRWWLAPLAATATVLLTVTVALKVGEEPATTIVPAERMAPAAVEAPQPATQANEIAPAAAPAAAPKRERAAEAQPAAAGAAAKSIGDMRDEAAVVAAPAPAPVAAPAPEAILPPRPRALASPEDSAPELQRAAPAAKAKLAAPAVDQSTLGTAEMSKSPAVWLNEIVALRKQGKEAQARAELQRFRAIYPDAPLPEELKDWLQP